MTEVVRARTPAGGPQEKSDLDLTTFLRILRRRLWVVLVVPVLVAGAAFGSAKAQTPKYRSSADILLVQTEAEALYAPSVAAAADPSRYLADEIRVIQSQQIATKVHSLLGYTPLIQASGSTTEDVMTLSAVSSNPKQATAVVNAYADSYLKHRISSSAAQNAAAEAEAQQQVNAAQAQLNTLDQAVAAAPVAQQAAIIDDQAAQRAPLDTQIANGQTELSQLQAAGAVDQGGAQLLDPASVPGLPYAPKPLRTAVLGLAIGVILGLGLAFLLDYVDNRIRGKEDLEQAAPNRPVMGLIPVHAEWKDPATAMAITLRAPESGAAEAYRTLRTSIQFLGLDRPLHTLQVTSPATSEGKTTTLVNLAIAFARAGRNVVVVDCDMRRPRIHQFFDLPQDPGFTSVLLGEIPLSRALLPVSGVEGLRVLTSGPHPPNPSELLAGQRTSEILEALATDCDLVLIDSPPLLPVSDGVVIAGRVDATLVVVNDGETKRKQLTRALELLDQVDATVIGTVLNQVAKNTVDYGYSYGYRPYTTKEPSSNGNGHANGNVQDEGNGKATSTDGSRTERPASQGKPPA